MTSRISRGYQSVRDQLDTISYIPLYRGNCGLEAPYTPYSFESMKPVRPVFNTLPNISEEFITNAPPGSLFRSTITGGKQQCIPWADSGYGVGKEACEALSGMYSMNCPSGGMQKDKPSACTQVFPMSSQMQDSCQAVRQYPWLKPLWGS